MRSFDCYCNGQSGGEKGIRTLDTTFRSYAPLAGEYLQPLGHLSVTVWRHYPSFGDPCQLYAFCKRLQSIDSRGPLRCSMWPKGHMAHIGGQRPKLKGAWGAQCTELNHCLKSLNMALVTTGFSPSWLSVCCSSAKLTCAATFSKSIRDSTFLL